MVQGLALFLEECPDHVPGYGHISGDVGVMCQDPAEGEFAKAMTLPAPSLCCRKAGSQVSDLVPS